MSRICLLYSFIFISCVSVSQKNISNAEFFWGTTDPGEGNGISIYPVDAPSTVYFDSLSYSTTWAGDFGVNKGSWKINNGPTNTISTGPNSGYNNSVYFYFESGWHPDNNETVIYKEDFKNQLNKGATHNGLNINNVDWNLNINTANLLNSNDYFKVVSGEYLRARDINSNAYFFSPTIDISNYTNVEASINFWKSGNLSNFDYVNCEYRVDGGNWTYFSVNGFKNGNFGNTVASQANINGNSLEIRITVNVDDADINFDDLKISGQPTSQNSEISSAIISEPVYIPNIFNSVDLNFKLHAFGIGLDSFRLALSNDNLIYNDFYSIESSLQTSSTDDFVNINLDISSFIGDSLWIKFIAKTDHSSNSYLGDVAIDNIEIIGQSVPGIFNNEFEFLKENVNSTPPSDSLVLLNIRLKDMNGNWGNPYKRVFLNYQNNTIRDIKITHAEYFWNADPGYGNGTSIQVQDGDFDEAIENIFANISGTPSFLGLNQLTIRVKDENGNWGPNFKQTINVDSPQDLKITAAEFFWGSVDPGQDNATALLVINGNYDEAFESVVNYNNAIDSGFNLLNVRVRDVNNYWGPLFKRTVYKNDSNNLDKIKVVSSEFFWGNTDPGEGNATSLLAFDGNYSEAIEQILSDVYSSTLNDSLNLLNVRVKDYNNNWGPIFKKVFLKYDSSNAIRDIKISQSEYYVDIDPGEGNATAMLVFDGNFNEAMESINVISSSLNFGFHNIGLRVKDENGIWGPTFKQTIYVDANPQNLRISELEYFWGTNDPGEGNASTLIAFDGNFNEAIEKVKSSSLTIDTGLNLLNIRAKDLNNEWSSVFKQVIFKNDSNQISDLKISMGEYFWGLNDPGEGNATTLIAFDGNYNEAIEITFADSATSPPNDSLNLLNIRVRDQFNRWGPLYKKIFLQYDSTNALRDIEITNSEYYWNADPGEGNGYSMIVFDGNFNEAFETMYSNISDTLSFGPHLFGIRVRDENNIWGPKYQKTIYVNSLPQDLKITLSEFFIGTIDPGEGNGSPLIVFDGNYNESLENIINNNFQLDTGFNLVNVRVRDLNNNWGPLYKITCYKNDSSLINYSTITAGEFFWDSIDVGQGNATPLLVLDGNYNEAIETIFADSSTKPLNDSLNLLNLRVRDQYGKWSPLYKRVFLQYDSLAALRDIKLTSSEYFWDTDPGEGNATPLIIFDGNYNEAIESVFKDSLQNPTSDGFHYLGLRIKDENQNWGPTFKRTVNFETPQNIKLTAGEFFWGISDPGFGQGIVMIVSDGNFNSAIESIVKHNLQLDSGLNLLNVRVKDLSNNWGPTFKRTIYKNDSLLINPINITQAEFYWDTTDPGVGNATAMLVFDGNYNEAFETVFADSATAPPNDSLNLLNIRVKDLSSNWGSTYKKVFLQYDSSNAIRDLKLTYAEYFWNTDPGEGSANPMLVFDGNYNESLEKISLDSLGSADSLGHNLFGIRTKDEKNEWGPTYYRTIFVDQGPQQLKITSGEYFWGTIDPGQDSGEVMIVFDGGYNEALESIVNSGSVLDSGLSILNVRIKDLNNHWGPVYKRTIYRNDSSDIRDIQVSLAEFFWGILDPGQGNAFPMIVFDGNYNEALELVLSDTLTNPPNDSLNLLNIRSRDEVNVWGPLYKKLFLQYDSSFAIRELQLTLAEFYWNNNDPGQGNAYSMLVFDGDFSEAIETILKDSLTSIPNNGLNVLNLRVKDEKGNWSPDYKRTLYKSDSASSFREIEVSLGEFFWGISDPGLGSGIPILSFDGDFDEEIENLFTDNIFSPGPDTVLFNLRVKDEEGLWGSTFKRSIVNHLPQYQLQIFNLGLSDTICFGDTLELEASGGINFKWENTTFIENDSLQTIKTFPDSSFTLMLTADNYYAGKDTAYYFIYVEQLPNISIYSTADSICNGETVTFTTSGTDYYLWNNGTIGNVNTISPSRDSLLIVNGTSNFGCINQDSVYVIVNYATSSPTIIDTSCNSYLLNGQTYSTSGLYQQTLVNNKGCDSTVTLDLQVNYSNSEIIPITACDSFMYYNTKYETSGLYTHYYINRFGCDSVESIDLTVNYTTYDTIDVTACESYFINNYNYYSSGTYHQTLVNTLGCDSLLTINLSLIYNTFGTDLQSACDTFISPDGSIFTNSGNYVYSLPNSIGCDSLVTLSLDVKNTTYGTDYQTSCNSYTWVDGQNYNSSTNTPIYYLTNSVGCDSIVNLDLTIINDIIVSNSVSVCDSFIDPNGQVYDSSGVYSYVLPASNGCDSLTQLSLNILKSYEYIIDTICNGNYNLNGQLYDSSGVYEQILINSNGCDSVITFDLTVQDDLQLSFVADQQVFLNPPFEVNFSNSSSNINQMNFTWDFGDGTTLQTNNNTVNHIYDFNGFYDVNLYATYNSTGCQDSLYAFEYIFCMGGYDDSITSIESYHPEVKLYPNPTSGRIYIEIGNYQDEFIVEVFDVAGKLILISNSQNIDISKQERGTYLFKINYANRTKTIRVVKH